MANIQQNQAIKKKAKAPKPEAVQPPLHLLDELRFFITRFCVFQDEYAPTAVALWAAHAHMITHFHTTPRLAVLSTEPSSGKTRVLEVLNLLVPEPLLGLCASPASIFRTLANRQITVLYDEIDTVWKNRGQDGDNNEDLRALFNAGYKRGATIPRCVGPQHDVKQFPVFAAVALAGLGELPETIMSRSVIIKMRRRSVAEKVDPFRTREHEAPGHALRDRLAEWAIDVGPAVGAAWPTLPPSIIDRAAEVWEPLISVADAAGLAWGGRAREAAVVLCEAALDRRLSLGIRLLADLRIVFGDNAALPTQTLIDRLCNAERWGLAPDAPWEDLYGKGLSTRKLADLLRGYSVGVTKIWSGERALQGYKREHLWDAWMRYLPPVSLTPGSPEDPEGVEGTPKNPGNPSVGANPGPSGSPSGSGRDPEGIGSAKTRENGRKSVGSPDLPDLPDFQEPESESF